ncbi:hypothetical protein K474DRAFT_1665318 [Panus rudis PR-1116 ss-1]|nr:hypothetical protein K474DRAFT_1665318 [Panus rudis PR-1116 ss-1]
MMPLDSLPEELLIQILGHLSIPDIIAVRETSKSLAGVTQEKIVWLHALRNLIIHNYPIPGLRGRSVLDLDHHELEKLALNAYEYRRNWTSAQPAYSRRIEIMSPSPRTAAAQHARILSIQFLSHRSRQLLLCLTLLDQAAEAPRSTALECWDITSQPARCIASLIVGSFASMVTNDVSSSPATLALSHASSAAGINAGTRTTTYAIDLGSSNASTSFVAIASFASLRYPNKLHENMFVCSDHTTNVMRVIDACSGDLLYSLRVPLIHDDPTISLEEFACLGVTFWREYILVFRQTWIHLYRLNEDQATTAATTESSGSTFQQELHPIAKHKWQWPIDSLAVEVANHTAIHTYPELASVEPRLMHSSRDIPPPVNIFVRFDSWYPWPVNILHHFILESNANYTAALPSTVDNVPYLFSSLSGEVRGPQLKDSVTSPMRLFTPSHIAMGRFGTAVWIDAETSTPGQAGDLGQRVAGRLLSTRLRSRHGNTSWATTGSNRTLNGQERGGLVAVLNLEANIEFAGNEYGIEDPMMVFAVKEEESTWNRVAVDDAEGRIAIGSTEGRVIVLDYALP